MKELLVVRRKGSQALLLDEGAIHAVFAVDELEKIFQRVADRSIVANHHVLQGLHQPALDVTGFGSLDSGIDQTFTTSHSVEEELLRRKSSEVRVLDEATSFWTEVILGEMRKRTVTETHRDTFSFNDLLTDTDRHLRDVNERTLRTGDHHLLDVVVLLQVLLRVLTVLVTSQIELTLNLTLE